MKINWGTKLMLAFGAFIALILYLVISASRQNTDLVATDYYAREIAFQDKINQRENTLASGRDVAVKIADQVLELRFSLPVSAMSPKGEITFLRPSDQHYDRTFDIATDDSGMQKLPLTEFARGMYDLTIEWNEGNEKFIIEKKIVMP